MRAVSSSQRKIVAHAVEDGGYWWGGHDSRGVPELIAPHTKPQGLHVPLPSSADIVDTVRSLFLFHKLEDFIDGCYCPQQGKIPHSDHEDRSHFLAILLQSGLLTIGQRIVRFDEFHTYAFVKLCFPNENQRKLNPHQRAKNQSFFLVPFQSNHSNTKPSTKKSKDNKTKNPNIQRGIKT